MPRHVSSYRHTPIFGFSTAPSDHPWKQDAARALRRRVRQTLATTLDGDRCPRKGREVVNPYTSPKDGKGWISKAPPKLMRK